MILIPIYVGLYLIGLIGEYKLLTRINKASGLGIKSFWVIVLSVVWPLTLYFTLTKEALA